MSQWPIVSAPEDDEKLREFVKAMRGIKGNNLWEPKPDPDSLMVYRKAIAAQPEIKDLFIKSLFQAARETIIYRNAFPPYVEKEKEHLWAYDNLPDFREAVNEAIEKLTAILATKRLTE